MSGFDSLTRAFAEWFNKPLNELPDDLRVRAEREFFPMPWDSLSADQRHSAAQEWDYHHDPATAELRKYWWEFFQRKGAIERQIEEWKAVATPTASDLATKEARLEQLHRDLGTLEVERQRAPGHREGESESAKRATDYPERYRPVSAADIKHGFRRLPDEGMSDKWWSQKMRDAKRNGLASARVGEGKKGPGGSLWHPDQVAIWLCEPNRKGDFWMKPASVRACLLRFPGGEEWAERLFPEME